MCECKGGMHCEHGADQRVPLVGYIKGTAGGMQHPAPTRRQLGGTGLRKQVRARILRL